jgi:hypothetical protein
MRWLIPFLALPLAAADPGAGPILDEDIPYSATIAVTNPHDRAIKVATLDTTCTCTRLEMVDRFILPNATGAIHIEVDNRNRSGPFQVGLTLFLTDPELEAIDIPVRWTIRPFVTVDSIPNDGDPAQRPPQAWRDVYRFVTEARPDEPRRLRKRIRLESPPETAPAGGLVVEGIDYAGTLWTFTPRRHADGSWLIVAGPAGQGPMPEGEYREEAVVRTNHPRKARIPLTFQTRIHRDVGRAIADPFGIPR